MLSIEITKSISLLAVFFGSGMFGMALDWEEQ